jgi:hypothetical protein
MPYAPATLRRSRSGSATRTSAQPGSTIGGVRSQRTPPPSRSATEKGCPGTPGGGPLTLRPFAASSTVDPRHVDGLVMPWLRVVMVVKCVAANAPSSPVIERCHPGLIGPRHPHGRPGNAKCIAIPAKQMQMTIAQTAWRKGRITNSTEANISTTPTARAISSGMTACGGWPNSHLLAPAENSATTKAPPVILARAIATASPERTLGVPHLPAPEWPTRHLEGQEPAFEELLHQGEATFARDQRPPSAGAEVCNPSWQ